MKSISPIAASGTGEGPLESVDVLVGDRLALVLFLFEPQYPAGDERDKIRVAVKKTQVP